MFGPDIMLLIVTTVGGAMLKLWAKKMEADHQREELLIGRLKVVETSRRAARRYQGPYAAIARFVMVLALVFSVFIAPFLLVVFRPEIPVIYAYLEQTQGFLFIFESFDKLRQMEMHGYVILPIHRQMAAAIFGFYFGGELVR